MTEARYEWRRGDAPRDGSHFIGLVIEPPDDDYPSPGFLQAREVWFAPIRGPFGEDMPWRSGGYGHDGRLGCESFGSGLLLGWAPLPPITRQISAEARRYDVIVQVPRDLGENSKIESVSEKYETPWPWKIDDLMQAARDLYAAAEPIVALVEFGEKHAPDTHDNDEIGVSVGLLRALAAALAKARGESPGESR